MISLTLMTDAATIDDVDAAIARRGIRWSVLDDGRIRLVNDDEALVLHEKYYLSPLSADDSERPLEIWLTVDESTLRVLVLVDVPTDDDAGAPVPAFRKLYCELLSQMRARFAVDPDSDDSVLTR
jgi:hypothetical protein